MEKLKKIIRETEKALWWDGFLLGMICGITMELLLIIVIYILV
jgi:hypothetical protein